MCLAGCTGPECVGKQLSGCRQRWCGTRAQEKGRDLCLQGSYRENSLLPAVFAAWPPGEESANRVVTLARAALAKSSAEMPCLPKSKNELRASQKIHRIGPTSRAKKKPGCWGLLCSPLLLSTHFSNFHNIQAFTLFLQGPIGATDGASFICASRYKIRVKRAAERTAAAPGYYFPRMSISRSGYQQRATE